MRKFHRRVLTLILQRIKIANVFLDSSMVEHTAVNRGVVGSSPTRGVIFMYKASRQACFVCREAFSQVCYMFKASSTEMLSGRKLKL